MLGEGVPLKEDLSLFAEKDKRRHPDYLERPGGLPIFIEQDPKDERRIFQVSSHPALRLTHIYSKDLPPLLNQPRITLVEAEQFFAAIGAPRGPEKQNHGIFPPVVAKTDQILTQIPQTEIKGGAACCLLTFSLRTGNQAQRDNSAQDQDEKQSFYHNKLRIPL